MNGFEKLTKNEKQDIIAGSWINIINNIGKTIAVIGGGVALIAEINGLLKSNAAIKGEIKTKEASFKWDNSKAEIDNTPIYFTY